MKNIEISNDELAQNDNPYKGPSTTRHTGGDKKYTGLTFNAEPKM